jgi:hypothetical protein
MMMTRFTILFAFILLPALSAGAQRLANHGLVVTGSVHKVEAKCEQGRPVIAVTLSLQTRNDSPRPIILIGGWSISTVKFNLITTKPGGSAESFVAADVLEYNPYREDPFGPGTPNDYDPDAEWVKNPERRKAPEPIPPGGYSERAAVIWLTSGFRLSAKSTEAFKACKPVSETPVPDYPTFYLEYRTSLKKYHRGDEVMRLLKERWKSIGLLPLDSSGDISYRSETIIFPK